MSLARLAAACIIFLLPGACLLHVTGQNPPAAKSPATIKVKVNLVLLPTRVTTPNGKPVGALTKEHFEIFEDGTEQELSWFEPVDAPVDVALVMDISGSTRPYVSLLKEAAARFVDRFGPADRLALYTVGPDVLRVHEFTSDRQSIKRAILRLNWEHGTRAGSVVLKTSHGQVGTLLYDGLLAVQNEFAAARTRRVILVFTDALDTGSTTTFEALNFSYLQGSAMLFAVMPDRIPEGLRLYFQHQMAEAEKLMATWKTWDRNKPPAGSSANKRWLVVLDFSAGDDLAKLEAFQQAAREFLSELSPRARVYLFDYRDRMRPLVIRAEGEPTAKARGVTPEEALQALPLSANADVNPDLRDPDYSSLHVERILLLTDARYSAQRLYTNTLRKYRTRIARLHPEKLDDPVTRREQILLLIHHPDGSWLTDLRGLDMSYDKEYGLQNLARDTGGDGYFVTQNIQRLNDLYDQIARQIRTSYTLGYYANAAGHHSLEVKVVDKKAVVQSRRAVIVAP